MRHVCMILVGLWLGATAAQAADPPGIKILVAYHSVTGNTEKLARGVAEGAKRLPGTTVVMKRVGQVTADDLFSADAVIVGSPVYWSNMAGEVKTFFDNWQLKFGVFPEFKMRDKVGRPSRPAGRSPAARS